MRTVISLNDESILAYSRMIHAAKPYFAQTAPKATGKPKEGYSKTYALLFDIALKIATENHEKLGEPQLSNAQVLDLLRQEAKQQSADYFPEIFHPTTLELQISDQDLGELVQIFHEDLANMQTPSYVTVKRLLEHGKEGMACDALAHLTHAHDKTVAVAQLIKHFLLKEDSTKVIELFSLLPEAGDRRTIASQILHHLLAKGPYETAVSLAKTMIPNDLRNHAMHEIALWLASHGHQQESIAVLGNIIENDDMKAYTLSLIVAALAGKHKFAEAEKLAATIHDHEYRQDAYNAIVDKMVRMRRIQEASAFIERLEGDLDKKEARKRISSAAKIHLQDKKIQKLSTSLTANASIAFIPKQGT